MKRTYAYIIAGATLMANGAITSCTGENTTGVDTETTTNEVDGRLNNPEGGTVTQDNVSPLDTANTNGVDMDSDTARTTTPSTDRGF